MQSIFKHVYLFQLTIKEIRYQSSLFWLRNVSNQILNWICLFVLDKLGLIHVSINILSLHHLFNLLSVIFFAEIIVISSNALGFRNSLKIINLIRNFSIIFVEELFEILVTFHVFFCFFDICVLICNKFVVVEFMRYQIRLKTRAHLLLDLGHNFLVFNLFLFLLASKLVCWRNIVIR